MTEAGERPSWGFLKQLHVGTSSQLFLKEVERFASVIRTNFLIPKKTPLLAERQ